GRLVRLADALHGVVAHILAIPHRVLPQRAGEIRPQDAGRDRIAAHVPGPHSTAMLRTSARSAAFEMPYNPSVAEPRSPPTEDTMMKDPPPRSAIKGHVI